jgi:hypothetical protein
MGKQELNCAHIYRDVGQPQCPDCKRDTHETNWQFQHELHIDWIKSGKAVKTGWWSI